MSRGLKIDLTLSTLKSKNVVTFLESVYLYNLNLIRGLKKSPSL